MTLSHDPTADDTVVGDDDDGDDGGQGSDKLEALVQFAVGRDTGQAGLTAQGDLGDHQGEAEGQSQDDVDQQENAAAVLGGQIGEAPQVAQTDCGASSGQNKTDAAGETASILVHDYTPLLKNLLFAVFCLCGAYRKNGN